jgi:arsenate reductase
MAAMSHVEPATPNDLPAIRALLGTAALPVDDVDDALLAGLLVVRGGNGLQGVVGLQHAGDAALLRSLAVAAEARSLGQGRVLLDAAEAQARAARIATLYLLTTSAADYFERHGFRHCDRRNAPDAIRSTAQFSSLCPASSFFMAKPLAATIWHNQACGTSRNTLALLRHAGIEPHVVEYLHTPPSRDALVAMIARAGLSVRGALREKGTPYLELGLDDTSLSDEHLLDAMQREPILINRPFVETALGARLCRPSEVVLDILPPVTRPFAKEDGEVVIDSDGRRAR